MRTARCILVSSLMFVAALGLVGCGDNDNSEGNRVRESIEIRCRDTGDRRIVNRAPDAAVAAAADLVPPASLEEVTDGVTLTVFPSMTATLSNPILQVFFASRSHPATECVVVSTTQSTVAVTVDGRQGVAVSFSQTDLAGFVDLLHSHPDAGDCSDVTRTSDLSIASVSVTSASLTGPFLLDGIAIGYTATTLPTAATVLPACL